MLEVYQEHIQEIIKVAQKELSQKDYNLFIRHTLNCLTEVILDNVTKN